MFTAECIEGQRTAYNIHFSSTMCSVWLYPWGDVKKYLSNSDKESTTDQSGDAIKVRLGKAMSLLVLFKKPMMKVSFQKQK